MLGKKSAVMSRKFLEGFVDRIEMERSLLRGNDRRRSSLHRILSINYLRTFPSPWEIEMIRNSRSVNTEIEKKTNVKMELKIEEENVVRTTSTERNINRIVSLQDFCYRKTSLMQWRCSKTETKREKKSHFSPENELADERMKGKSSATWVRSN